MASSQVEIASSSPFACVLKDRNRHGRCSRESNARAAAAFQKNLKELVRDHLHTCISVSSDSASNENSGNENGRCDRHHPTTNGEGAKINNTGSSLNMSTKHANILDQFAAWQAREVERESQEAGLLISSSRTPSTKKSSENSGTSERENFGSSSLVQIWEARLNRSGAKLNQSSCMNNNQNPVASASRMRSGFSSIETASKEKSRHSSMNTNQNREAGASRKISCSRSNETAPEEKLRPPNVNNNPNTVAGSCCSSSGSSSNETASEGKSRHSIVNSNPHPVAGASRAKSGSSNGTASEEKPRHSSMNNISNPVAGTSRTNSGSRSNETASEEKSRRFSINNNPNPLTGASRTRSGSSSSETAAEEKSRHSRMNANPIPVAGASKTCSGSSFKDTASEEESRRTSMNSNPNLVASSSRTSSGSSSNEATSDAKSRNSDISESATNEDSAVDTDSISQVETSSVQSRSLDEGEKERIRIADIIRRLTSDASDHEQQGNGAGDGLSRESRHASGCEQAEQKAFSQVVRSPRIRGRQAFNDLLSQMDEERQRDIDSLAERQAVSKFTQRGRIQSMLRLRLLQRDMAIQDQQRPQSSRSNICNDNNRPQGSTIMHLRERYSSGVKQDTTTLSEAAIPRSTIDMVNSSINIRNSSAHDQLTDNRPHKETNVAEQRSRSPVEDSLSHKCEGHEDVNAESIARTQVTWRGTNMEIEDFHPHRTSQTTPSWNGWDGNEIEGAYGEQYFEETNYDWFNDIARPRSYWEDQRQAWYHEKLSTSSADDEIRQLIERRTVSNFIGSDFREKIDDLMVARALIQINHEELKADSQERMAQLLLSRFQRHSNPACSQEEEGQQEEVHDGREVREEEEDNLEEEQVSREEDIESPISGQYPEAAVYFYPSSPSMYSPYASWNYREDQATPSRRPLPSLCSSQDGRYSSSMSHLSFGMEMVRDMDQLQREMSELRKSIQTCMELQVNLQKSLKQEIHEGETDEKFLLERSVKKRGCCICNEKQVDSFLYRCGHMCTCLKCARELQKNSGLCPMCRAPILDVVRAYVDS